MSTFNINLKGNMETLKVGSKMENIQEVVRERAKSHEKVYALMSFVNKDNLKAVHRKQDKNKAPGMDGITKEMYERNLDANLDSLIQRMKQFSYRPLPVKRVYIDKGNGKKRPLGLPSYEDRLVQGVMKEVLEGIYETKFYDFSYGFRPKRKAHDAVLRVNHHIMFNKVNYILDCDIKGFFDNIEHRWMMKFLEHDIADKNFLRYIKRFLIGGILEEGKVLTSDKGTPQGSLMSTVLANVYLHYVLDDWYAKGIKRRYKGEVYLVRYADDFVVMFQYENEARKFIVELEERMAKFGLEIEREKTRILPFGKYKGTKETFDFLGFTFINGKTRNNKYRVIFRTSKKKLKQKKARLKKWIYENMHEPMVKIVKKLNEKLVGHYTYYGIFSNYIGIRNYYEYAKYHFMKSMRRRSQRPISWKRLLIFMKHIPLKVPRLYVTRGY